MGYWRPKLLANNSRSVLKISTGHLPATTMDYKTALLSIITLINKVVTGHCLDIKTRDRAMENSNVARLLGKRCIKSGILCPLFLVSQPSTGLNASEPLDSSRRADRTAVFNYLSSLRHSHIDFIVKQNRVNAIKRNLFHTPESA